MDNDNVENKSVDLEKVVIIPAMVEENQLDNFKAGNMKFGDDTIFMPENEYNEYVNKQDNAENVENNEDAPETIVEKPKFDLSEFGDYKDTETIKADLAKAKRAEALEAELNELKNKKPEISEKDREYLEFQALQEKTGVKDYALLSQFKKADLNKMSPEDLFIMKELMANPDRNPKALKIIYDKKYEVPDDYDDLSDEDRVIIDEDMQAQKTKDAEKYRDELSALREVKVSVVERESDDQMPEIDKFVSTPSVLDLEYDSDVSKTKLKVNFTITPQMYQTLKVKENLAQIAKQGDDGTRAKAYMDGVRAYSIASNLPTIFKEHEKILLEEFKKNQAINKDNITLSRERERENKGDVKSQKEKEREKQKEFYSKM